MSGGRITLLSLGAVLLWLGPALMGQGAAGLPCLAQGVAASTKGGDKEAGLRGSSVGFATLPLAFEPLDGQGEFLARGPNYQFHIAPGRVQFVLARRAAAPGAPLTERARSVASPGATARALCVEFAGANPQARTSGRWEDGGENQLPGRQRPGAVAEGHSHVCEGAGRGVVSGHQSGLLRQWAAAGVRFQCRPRGRFRHDCDAF